MRIGSNVGALNARNKLDHNQSRLSTALERASAGLRINRASDDGAGLAVSETFRAQVRGSAQAVRNLQDGLSLIQTADGGAQEATNILQRLRELAVEAANGVMTDAQRQGAQAEVEQLLLELDRAATSVTFNDLNVLSGSGYTDADRTFVENALTNGILKDAYDAAVAAYGLSHAAVPNLPIYLDDTTAPAAAYVQGSFGPLGNPGTLELHIGMDYILPALQGGDTDGVEYVIAHEMVHATMFDEVNMAGLPTWFVEGTAEFALGADDRVRSSLLAMGGSTPANQQTLINRLSNAGWGGTSDDYSAGYLATKYLHDQLPGGLQNAFQNVLDDTANDFDDVVALAGYADRAAFLADFKANGVAWMAANVDLTDADLGGITGADYGGPVRDHANRVTTTGSAADPTPWNETFEPVTSGPIVIQAGANEGDTISLAGIDITTGALGVDGLTIANQLDAQLAIDTVDDAITELSTLRASLGAQANRLEHAIASQDQNVESQSAAESRIRDADMAAEATELSRAQVLTNTNMSMLAAANARPSAVRTLLAAIAA